MRRAGFTLAALTGVWLAAAWSSGAFLPEHRDAVAASEFTDDGFSSKKVIADLPHGRVAYIDEGAGAPVVLLHGCPFSAFEWSEVLPLLTTRFRVIVPDLRGLGDTPVTLDDDYRLPTDVTMVRELLDHLGIERAAFVAHDHGGATLQLLMEAEPGRIDRAVLTNVEAYDEWPSEPELIYLRLIVNPFTSPLMYHALHSETVQREVFSVAVHDRDVLTSATLHGWTAPHIGSGARWQRLRRFFRWQLDPDHQRLTSEIVPALRKFERPVLLVWGSRDDNFGPDIASRLANDLPGTKGIVLLDQSSHMPMQEQPAEYAAAVIDFLADDHVDAAATLALDAVRREP